MALLTLAQAKAYLRRNDTLEDALISDLLTAAIGAVSGAIIVPIVGVNQTVVDRCESFRMTRPVRSLIVPYPVKATAPTDFVITDSHGNILPSGVGVAVYDVLETGTTGLIFGVSGYYFTDPPYTIAGTFGLDQAPNYAIEIEPQINAVLRDLVSVWYQQRNPNATSEGEGLGATVAYGPNSIPPRTLALLNSFVQLRG